MNPISIFDFKREDKSKCYLPLLVFLLSAIIYDSEIKCQEVNTGSKIDQAKINLAKIYMEEGQEHYLAGRYNEAAITFMKAYSVAPFSAFLFNTAVAYEKMEYFKHAREFFERYLEAEPDAPDRDKITGRIKQLQEKEKSLVEQSEIKNSTPPPSQHGSPPEPPIIVEKKECANEDGVKCKEKSEKTPEASLSSEEMKSLLSVSTNPPGASISVTKYPEEPAGCGISPFNLTVEQGKYKITVEHPKYKTVNTIVDVSGGRIYIVLVEMSQGEFLGYLSIRTQKKGAEVFLDTKEGGSLGKTPLGLSVPAGKHIIWVEQPGFKPVKKEVEIGVGEEKTLKIQMERVDYGILTVKTNVPNSFVILDSRVKVKAPFSKNISPGTHKVKVTARRMKAIQNEIKIEKGMKTSLLVRLNPAPLKTYAWVSFGIAAAVLATGTTLACLAGKTKRELDDELASGYLQNQDPRIDKGLWLSIGADISFFTGGIFTILGIYYLFRDKLPDSEAKIIGPEDIS